MVAVSTHWLTHVQHTVPSQYKYGAKWSNWNDIIIIIYAMTWIITSKSLKLNTKLPDNCDKFKENAMLQMLMRPSPLVPWSPQLSVLTHPSVTPTPVTIHQHSRDIWRPSSHLCHTVIMSSYVILSSSCHVMSPQNHISILSQVSYSHDAASEMWTIPQNNNSVWRLPSVAWRPLAIMMSHAHCTILRSLVLSNFVHQYSHSYL